MGTFLLSSLDACMGVGMSNSSGRLAVIQTYLISSVCNSQRLTAHVLWADTDCWGLRADGYRLQLYASSHANVPFRFNFLFHSCQFCRIAVTQCLDPGSLFACVCVYLYVLPFCLDLWVELQILKIYLEWHCALNCSCGFSQVAG
jgi:hypothetical protein